MHSGPWFVAPDGWAGSEIVLAPSESHHALNVMRLKPSEAITVTDGRGMVARGVVARVEDGSVVVEVIEQTQERSPRPEIVVYQAAAKGSKIDDAVERLAELGVAETWIFTSARTVVKWDRDRVARLEQRWTDRAVGAAKQSRNPFVMRVGGGLTWEDLLQRVRTEPLAAVLWEEASLPLRVAVEDTAARIALIVGPEGGLERSEAESLADAGAQLVSLGPRILRTENAAFAAVAALQYHFGLLG